MENAAKALYIASGVLIGALIIVVAVTLFSNLQVYVDESRDQIRFNDLNSFNTKYTNYINSMDDGRTIDFELKIQDVVTAANLAYENNLKLNYDAYKNVDPPESNDNLYVAVYLISTSLGKTRMDGNNDINKIMQNNLDKTYLCNNSSIEYNPNSGRVCKVTFKEISR